MIQSGRDLLCAAGTIEDDVAAQCGRALDTIAAARAAAGASLADILPNREDFASCWPVLRERLGEARQAATMMVAGLADPRMRIEIEMTAFRRRT